PVGRSPESKETESPYWLADAGTPAASPCFANTAFSFSMSGGPPAFTIAAVSLKNSGPMSAATVSESSAAEPAHRGALEFAVGFAFFQIFAFVVLRFAFAHAEGDFDLAILPIE